MTADYGAVEWAIEEGVRCVVCPGCAFTFDAFHTDTGSGGYSCPNCGFGTSPNDGSEWRCEECHAPWGQGNQCRRCGNRTFEPLPPNDGGEA